MENMYKLKRPYKQYWFSASEATAGMVGRFSSVIRIKLAVDIISPGIPEESNIPSEDRLTVIRSGKVDVFGGPGVITSPPGAHGL